MYFYVQHRKGTCSKTVQFSIFYVIIKVNIGLYQKLCKIEMLQPIWGRTRAIWILIILIHNPHTCCLLYTYMITLYSIMYTVYTTVYIYVYFIQYYVYSLHYWIHICILYTVLCIQSTLLYTYMYTLYSIMYTVYTTVYIYVQLCLIFMRTIARKRLVLFYWYDAKALNLRMNQMSKV